MTNVQRGCGGCTTPPPREGQTPRSEPIDMGCYNGGMESFVAFVGRILPTCAGGVRPTSDTSYCFPRDLLAFLRAAVANVRGDTHA